MGEEFLTDYMTGAGFAITAFFVAYGCTAMFKAFKLAADVG
jgi:hypothetical protein